MCVQKTRLCGKHAGEAVPAPPLHDKFNAFRRLAGYRRIKNCSRKSCRRPTRRAIWRPARFDHPDGSLVGPGADRAAMGTLRQVKEARITLFLLLRGPLIG
jgi:hypothetical protein